MNDLTLLNKLKQAKELINECIEHQNSDTKQKRVFKEYQKDSRKKISTDILSQIVNKIHSCKENEKIEQNILDKTLLAGRILLPLYICHKYFPDQVLTTGDIEKITSELNIKIASSNISKEIKNSLRKYLESDSARIKGRIIYYKLNRKGAKYFESLLNVK